MRLNQLNELKPPDLPPPLRQNIRLTLKNELPRPWPPSIRYELNTIATRQRKHDSRLKQSALKRPQTARSLNNAETHNVDSRGRVLVRRPQARLNLLPGRIASGRRRSPTFKLRPYGGGEPGDAVGSHLLILTCRYGLDVSLEQEMTEHLGSDSSEASIGGDDHGTADLP